MQNVFDSYNPHTTLWHHQCAWRLMKATLAGGPALLQEECRQLHEVIQPKTLEQERLLAGRCWFEYGYLRPMERNQLFTEAYVAAFRRLHLVWSGSGTPAYDPVRPRYELNSLKDINSLMAARQLADALGLPYRTFCGHVIEGLMKSRGHHYMPRPNQLAGSEARELVDREHARLLRGLGVRDRFGPSCDNRLQADQYVGDPTQLSALSALQDVVELASVPHTTLGHLMRDGFISEAEARRRFSEARVNGALRDVGPAKFAENGPGLARPFRPSCFALALDETKPTCSACPVATFCRAMTDRVAAAQITLTGFADPRSEHERQAARNRKRKERYYKTPEGIASLEAGRLELIQHIPALGKIFPTHLGRKLSRKRTRTPAAKRV